MSFIGTFTEDGSLKYSKPFENIVTDGNPQSRFCKIVAMTTNKHVEEHIKDEITTIPLILSTLFEYMQELAFRYIRVQTVKILLEVCKLRKIPLYTSTEDLKDIANLPECLEDIELHDIAEPKKPDLVDLGHDSILPIPTPKDKPETDKFDKSPTIEALDLAFSEFKDGKYSFKIKDLIPKPEEISESDKTRYNRIVESVSLVNKNLIRQIKDIKVYNTGGKNSGLDKGKLDKRNIHKYRYSDKIFYNNTYKIKESDLAFGIILDVSGSMAGSGIKNGVTTLVVLHETLKALGINHSIVTHESSRNYQCNIRRYQLFKEDKGYKVTKNYNLMSINAEYGNCDSAALYYMEKAMSRVRNKDKIVIMFSDGAPTECTGTELKEQVRKMERQGIKVIGVGINYPSIAEYYSDYANGRNLKEMLDIVTKILKQYVLDKKE
jgi:uncharacterized protein YegL